MKSEMHYFFAVITWLNKQLNEIQLTRKQEMLGTSTSNTVSRTGSSPHSMVIVKILCIHL